jgi:tetratricopeptide (TPR) repeat protein
VKYKAVHRVLLGMTLACVIPGQGAAADPAPSIAVSAEPDGLRALIAALGSIDPDKRDAAAAKIVEMGAEARRAVFQASRLDDPELRARAASLLLRLPWYLPDDSPVVRQLLVPYGQLDADKRKETVYQLATRGQHGYEALARLVAEEPNDDVKWAVVSMVRETFDKGSLDYFRNLKPDAESAPLLAAQGHAWLPENVAKGEKLLKAALVADLNSPSNDGGEVEITYDRLQNLALLDGRYDDVAELLRQRARRGASDAEGNPTMAVLNLFGAHGKFGPLKGFEKDLETYHDQLGDPRIMFALGKVYERCGQRALADAAFRSAFLADLVSIPQRFEQGDFLIRQGWLDLAEGEFTSIFDLTADHSGEVEQMSPELDLAAADHMQKALELHFKGRGQLRGATDVSLRQEVSWHYLRAAKARGDKIEVEHHLDELAGDLPSNPDIANDVVPMLRELGRDKEAQELFDRTYASLQQALDARSDHPMPKNNIAWLCARCGEHKGEALQLAEAATKAMPDNAAFLDTLAEANFQLGKYKEAAKLEERVVRARPGDRFLQGQLKRFKKAAKENKGQ